MSLFLPPPKISSTTVIVRYKLFWCSGVLLSSYVLFSVATTSINFIIEFVVFLQYFNFVYM